MSQSQKHGKLTYMLMLTVVVAIWIASILFEYSAIRRYANVALKNTLAFFALISIITAPILVGSANATVGILLGVVGLYRAMNIARLYAARLPVHYAQSIMLRTLRILSILQGLVLSAFMLTLPFDSTVSIQQILTILALLSFFGAIIISISTIANIWGSQPEHTTDLIDNEYPTLTVAIAARNETPALMECLQSVVASTYPKLEVLVFDDNSQDTTADIIKSFAQDGVRFITWEYSKGEWLAKNKAYQILLEHASGDIILFMGVDIRLDPASLQRAVEQMLAKDATMLGLVPKRTKSGLLAVFVQPVRYWWELAVPKIARRRPPVLSTAWLVKRYPLLDLGGFTSYKRSIVPEEHLARYFSLQGSYSFIRSTGQLLFTTQKTFGSQWDTQVRTRYPHAHRRPETAFLQSALLVCVVLSPFIMLPLSIVGALDSGIVVLSALAVAAYVASHIAISIITNPIAGLFALINFPVAILLDIIALHESMLKYEFSKVIWKGRDIAPKKLEVIAKLPSIAATPDSENTH